jgi:hypothetical protein
MVCLSRPPSSVKAPQRRTTRRDSNGQQQTTNVEVSSGFPAIDVGSEIPGLRFHTAKGTYSEASLWCPVHISGGLVPSVFPRLPEQRDRIAIGGDPYQACGGPVASRKAGTMRRLLTVLVALAAVVALAGPAHAAGPVHLGPFHDQGEFTVDCGDFEASVSGTVTTWFTIWTDDAGEVTKFFMRVLAPADTWTNTTTGASIVVRGEFVQTAERVPGTTDEWTVTVRGHRYMVNEPGEGLILADVGRIVYGNLDEDDILSAAGRHDLALPQEVEPRICAAIA